MNNQNFGNKLDRIGQLWPTISNMSPDELKEHVRQIRADRRKVKKPAKTKKATVNKSEATANRIKKLVGDNPALLAKLLGELEDGSKG